MLRRSVPALMALALLAACAPASPPSATPVAEAPSGAPAAEQAVGRVLDEWVSAYNADRADAVARLHAENGLFVTGNGSVYRGRADIQEMLAASAPYSTDFGLADRKVSVSGDYAFETGVPFQTITPRTGEPYQSRGKYNVVYVRQPDGTWKVQTLVARSNRVPTQPNEAAIRKTIADYFAAIRAPNPDAWVGSFAANAVMEDPVGSPPMQGHPALREFFMKMGGLFRSIALTEEDVVVNGNYAAVKWSGHAVGKTGKEARFEGVDVFEFDEQGKIRRGWGYWNPGPVIAAVQ